MKILLNLLKVFADGNSIESLRELAQDINVRLQQIQAAADADGRELNDEEAEEVEGLFEQFESVTANIERRERIAAQADALAARNNVGRRTIPAHGPSDPDGPDTYVSGGSKPKARRITVEEERLRDPKRGFSHMGDFATAVFKASRPNGFQDPRLTILGAPTTVGTEGTGQDGGFAVPPDFRQDIAKKIMGEESLLSRTDMTTTSSNSLTYPVDETSPWGTTGIRAYWEDELAQMTQSKPRLGQNTVRLNKLTALVPVTEELLSDAPAMDSYLRQKTPIKMDFAINEAIVRGDGVGKPLGIINAPAAVTVSAESGPQAADTIVVENVVKMWSRMPGALRGGGVWLANQDVEPQLIPLKIQGSNSGVFPVYMPPGGLSATPYGTLFGRPVIPTEACSILGDAGDLIFVNLSQYMTAVKTTGIRVDVSMHLWFDYDTMAYRFIFRVAGQPWWGSAWDRRDSNSPTLSPYVVLGARTGS